MVSPHDRSSRAPCKLFQSSFFMQLSLTSSLFESLQHFSVLGRVLHQCHLLRSDMINFVLALSNYVMFEVLETSWQWLVNKIKGDDDAATAVALGRADMPTAAESGLEVEDIADRKTKASYESPRSGNAAPRSADGGHQGTADSSRWWNSDLDLSGLIRAHEEYLARIMEKALLTGTLLSLSLKLSLIWHFAQRFCCRPVISYWAPHPGFVEGRDSICTDSRGSLH